MTTLRDVARLSGVSPATVSNVLNNRIRNTTPETRQRVLDAIRQLGYQPGAAPPGNGSRTTRTIGILMWLASYAPLTTYPYALTLLDGILSVGLANHWNVTLVSVEHWTDARAQVRLYADGRCDGFILMAPSEKVSIPEALQERNYPFVVIGSSSADPIIDSVGIDDFEAFRALTAHVIGAGHKRIAYLVGEEDMEDVARRVKGYEQAFADAGLSVRDDWYIRPGSYHIPSAMSNLDRFLERVSRMPTFERPTALLCSNDQVAFYAWKRLTDRGIRVPEEMSLTGFDDTSFAQKIEPRLTTVKQPLFDMGMRSCEILLSRIDHPNRDTPAIKEIYPHELVVGGSVVPPRIR
jgi:LacI family transcriptional regulator